MTISMSEQAFINLELEIYAQVQHPDSADSKDLLLPYPSWLLTGYRREVELREGLELEILDVRLRDRWEFAERDRQAWVCFHFHLSGEHQSTETKVGNLEYAFYGSGLAPKGIVVGLPEHRCLEVVVCIQPEVLISFLGHQGELPPEFQHLIRPVDKKRYARVGTISLAMQRVLWQIMRCPYVGLQKRMFWEGKALELSALVLGDEREIQQGRELLIDLKPDYVDRIRRAREILRQNLHQPPSLMELARQVGLNDYSLKCGFKRVFGKTVFGYLHDYRMEQASQLLMSGEMRVIEVMQQVGLGDRKYFAAAFRKKFGVSPRDYLNMQFVKKSV